MKLLGVIAALLLVFAAPVAAQTIYKPLVLNPTTGSPQNLPAGAYITPSAVPYSVPTIGTITGGNWSTAPAVNVLGINSAGDGGGGLFAKVASCVVDTDGAVGGTCIQDAVGTYFQRQNVTALIPEFWGAQGVPAFGYGNPTADATAAFQAMADTNDRTCIPVSVPARSYLIATGPVLLRNTPTGTECGPFGLKFNGVAGKYGTTLYDNSGTDSPVFQWAYASYSGLTHSYDFGGFYANFSGGNCLACKKQSLLYIPPAASGSYSIYNSVFHNLVQNGGSYLITNSGAVDFDDKFEDFWSHNCLFITDYDGPNAAPSIGRPQNQLIKLYCNGSENSAAGTVTGTVSGTTLTITNGPTVITMAPGIALFGGGLTSGTHVVSGSGATWTLSQSSTIGSPTTFLAYQMAQAHATSISVSGTTLTINTWGDGTYAPGQSLAGLGVPCGTYIVSNLSGGNTGSGANGSTWQLNQTATITTQAATFWGPAALNLFSCPALHLDAWNNTYGREWEVNGTVNFTWLNDTAGGTYTVDNARVEDSAYDTRTVVRMFNVGNGYIQIKRFDQFQDWATMAGTGTTLSGVLATSNGNATGADIDIWNVSWSRFVVPTTGGFFLSEGALLNGGGNSTIIPPYNVVNVKQYADVQGFSATSEGLVNNSINAAADATVVTSWNNPSYTKYYGANDTPDASPVQLTGYGPATSIFNTTFSGEQTIDLPADTSNYLFSGEQRCFEVPIAQPYNLIIVANGGTLATLHAGAVGRACAVWNHSQTSGPSKTWTLTTLATPSTVTPTLSGTGLGTSPAITGNGSGTITVGSSPANAGFTLTMSAAATGWACSIQDNTNNASLTVGQTATTTTTAVMQGYSRTTGLASALTAADALTYQCNPY